MLKFNPQQPYTRTFGEAPAGMVYFQDGLYFAADGTLTDCDHNRTVYAARGQSFSDALRPAAPPAPATSDTPPAPPVPVDALDGMAPADVFAVSERLRAQLDVAEDADNYVPTLEATEENVAFIRRHTK